jgi:DNA-binding MarR family transcriptional regulator
MIDDILELKSRCNFGDEIGRSYRLTAREVGCILHIASHQQMTSKELSQLMNLSASRGSRIISRLSERGFIHIEQDSEDRRSYKISLTTDGESCYEDILKQKQLCEELLTSRLSEEEKLIVSRGLNLLLHVM